MERSRRDYNNLSELIMLHIKEHADLWIELIESADISSDLKNNVTKIMQYFVTNATTSWHSVDDAIYGTIRKLLAATEHDPEESEAKSLFENLRDDLLALQKEAREEYLA